MRACILAAGRGTRLASTGHLLPKGLLRLDPHGPSLIEQSLDCLRSYGVRPVVVVTGYGREHFESLARHRPEMVCCYNPRFADWGSLASLACALPHLEGEGCLLLESDLVYEPRAIRLALDHPSPDLVLLSGPTRAGDEVWVETDPQGSLVGMSKRPAELTASAGELVGISKLSPGLLDRLGTLAAEYPHGDYEIHGLTRAARLHPIPCLVIPDLVWAEVDDERHLQRARQEVYPQLQALPRRAAGKSPPYSEE